MRKLIFIIVVISLFITSCGKQDKMVLVGDSSNKNLIKVEVCNAKREVLGGVAVKGNKFKVEIANIKYPQLGFIRFVLNNKDYKSKTKKCIIENETVYVSIDNNRKVSALRGGKLNQELINSWEESDAYKCAVAAMESFKKSGRYIYFSKHTLLETKLQLKEMYNTLKKWIIEAKRDILEKKLKGNTAAAQLIIIQQVGINENTRKYLDGIEKKLGKTAAIAELRKKERSFLRNKEKDALLAVGKYIPNFKLKTPRGKQVDLLSVINKNKYTLIQFEDFTYYRSKDGYKQLRNAYKKYHKKGLEIVSVAITDNKKAWIKNIAKHRLKWIQCSDLDGDKSDLIKKYRIKNMNQLPINFLVNSKGKILERDISGYKFRDKFKGMFQ